MRRTRWDELAAPYDRLAAALGTGEHRAVLERLVVRCGWGARSTREPLLPSGVRHGVPWGLSVAMSPGAPPELRVFLEAQCEPASAAGYWAAGERVLDGLADGARVTALGRGERLWHAVGFAAGRAPWFHAYVCVPTDPALAWAALARGGHAGERLRQALGPRARVTIVSADVEAGPAARTKLYAILPDARADEVPGMVGGPGLTPAGSGAGGRRGSTGGGAAFATAMTGREDARLGWLVAYGFTAGAADPTSVALHYGAAVHGDAGYADRLAAYARALELDAYPRAAAALGSPRHHFASWQRTATGAPRLTVYFLPEVAR